MKKVIALLLAVIMVCGLMVGCGDSKEPAGSAGAPVKTSGKKIDLNVKLDTIGEESKPVKTEVPEGKAHIISIALDKTDLSIALGTKQQITYTVKPDTAFDKSVYYESQNTNIAKVDKDGYVLGVGCGTIDIVVKTNDQGFKRVVTVVVHQNAGDDKKAEEMLNLINKGREANNQAAFTSDDVALKAAANQRALEEAVDMVNNKAKAMDDKRTDKTTTIFADYDIFVRQNAALYVWGDYSKDTKKAYEALVKNEDNAKALGIKGGEVNYDNVAVGYFVFNNVTYWCVLMATT
ncbi:MAG: Ig-like domain-containing protein [Clostridia bacterium]|nr:Ig-like domain-containing protein [Clostridia bacterium]